LDQATLAVGADCAPGDGVPEPRGVLRMAGEVFRANLPLPRGAKEGQLRLLAEGEGRGGQAEELVGIERPVSRPLEGRHKALLNHDAPGDGEGGL